MEVADAFAPLIHFFACNEFHFPNKKMYSTSFYYSSFVHCASLAFLGVKLSLSHFSLACCRAQIVGRRCFCCRAPPLDVVFLSYSY